MSAANALRYVFLAYLSKPVEDRPLYRLIRRHRLTNFLQLGIRDGQLATRAIDVGLRYSPAESVRYTGIDLFEARPAGSLSLPLKAAHQLFRPRGIKAQLVPGDAGMAMTRIANSLQGVQLVLISADQTDESLERAWFYLPRVLDVNCHVFRQRKQGDQFIWQPISRIELQSLATRRRSRQAA